MRRLIVVVAVSAALLGCAGQQLQKGLGDAIGTNINTLVYKWGYPNSKREMMGQTIYVWTNAFSSSYVVPQTQTTTGYVGTTPIYGTTTSYTTQTINAQCVIEVGVDDDDTIQNFQYRGNQVGCQPYASRLMQ